MIQHHSVDPLFPSIHTTPRLRQYLFPYFLYLISMTWFHTHSTRAQPTAPPPQIKTLQAEGTLDIISEQRQQLIAAVPILFHSFICTEASHVFHLFPILVSYRRQLWWQEQIWPGFISLVVLPESHRSSAKIYKGKQRHIFIFWPASSVFWLLCCLGFIALVLSTTLLSVRTLL